MSRFSEMDWSFIRESLEISSLYLAVIGPLLLLLPQRPLILTLHVRVIHVVTDRENVYAHNLGKQELTRRNSEI
jgi:hypothetical protein